MNIKSAVAVACFGIASVLLVVVLVTPQAALPAWISGPWGGLAVYALAAVWVFLAVTLLDRFRRSR